jgi:hypothetical protein
MMSFRLNFSILLDIISIHLKISCPDFFKTFQCFFRRKKQPTWSSTSFEVCDKEATILYLPGWTRRNQSSMEWAICIVEFSYMIPNKKNHASYWTYTAETIKRGRMLTTQEREGWVWPRKKYLRAKYLLTPHMFTWTFLLWY